MILQGTKKYTHPHTNQCYTAWSTIWYMYTSWFISYAWSDMCQALTASVLGWVGVVVRCWGGSCESILVVTAADFASRSSIPVGTSAARKALCVEPGCCSFWADDGLDTRAELGRGLRGGPALCGGGAGRLPWLVCARRIGFGEPPPTLVPCPDYNSKQNTIWYSYLDTRIHSVLQKNTIFYPSEWRWSISGVRVQISYI